MNDFNKFIYHGYGVGVDAAPSGFAKVSYQRFLEDCQKIFPDMPEEEIKTAYEGIKIPSRATWGSAGYDISTPFPVELTEKNPTATIPTGLKVYLTKNTFLMIVPRSGVGFKTGMTLANTVGIIDADYCESDNEGHIMAKFRYGFAPLSLKAGDRFAQGIVCLYGIFMNEEPPKSSRNGGFGSTGTGEGPKEG